MAVGKGTLVVFGGLIDACIDSGYLRDTCISVGPSMLYRIEALGLSGTCVIKKYESTMDDGSGTV